MSSNIPTRRITRATRAGVINNNKENALAKPGRTAAARAKPPSADGTSKPAPVRAAASTAAARTKTANGAPVFIDPAAQGKRKREALGEVPKPPVNRARPENGAGPGPSAFKGKERVRDLKEKFDGVIVKTTTTKTTTTVRQPLRSVGGTATTRRLRSAAAEPEEQQPHQLRTASRRQLQKVVEELPEAEEEEDAMAIDQEPVPSPRRFVAARHSAASQRSAGRVQPTSRAQAQARRSSARHSRYDEDEEEGNRAFKKRRTSSDAPEEAEVEARALGVETVTVEASYEADPDGDEWDDLDAEDTDDPLMVSEYVVEIFEYLKQVEQKTMPNPNYMENQKDLAWKMRGILTDWLIQVHSRFKLLPETLFLCINIIDRFLSARVVSLAKLQLVGITCMFIAAKVEEIVAPSTMNFLYCADSSYKEPEILQAERYILKTIDWNLSYPNPIHFLRRISKADDYNIQVRTTAKYLIEIQCLEWRLIAAPPSLMAAAAVWLSRLVLGFPDWTANLAHYSSYPESALIPTANLMLNYILKPVRHQSFYKKYAGKKFMKASIFVREWALSRWHEGSQVALHHELADLKKLIRQAREREERAVAEAENEEYEIL